jgi:hypothetical protein
MQRIYVIECAEEFHGACMTDDRVQVSVKTADPQAQQKFMDGVQAWFGASGRPAALAAAAAHGGTPDVLARMGLDPVLRTGPRVRFGSLQCCQVTWYRGSDKATVTMRETNAQLHCLFAVDLDDPTVGALAAAAVQQYLHAWLVSFVDHVFRDPHAEEPPAGPSAGPPPGAGVGL